eukprot:m51a1_g2061 putative C-tail anchored protein (163) ;mRNA; f:1425917-1426639
MEGFLSGLFDSKEARKAREQLDQESAMDWTADISRAEAKYAREARESTDGHASRDATSELAIILTHSAIEGDLLRAVAMLRALGAGTDDPSADTESYFLARALLRLGERTKARDVRELLALVEDESRRQGAIGMGIVGAGAAALGALAIGVVALGVVARGRR